MLPTIYAYDKVSGKVPTYIQRDPHVVSCISSDIFDVCKYMISKGYTHCIEDTETMYFSKEPLGVTNHVWSNLDQYYNILYLHDIQEGVDDMKDTFKQYLLTEAETYIENVEDERACNLSDSQAKLLAETIADILSEDEWLSMQIMERISDEYQTYIGRV